MEKLSFKSAIVGCGSIAQVHIKSLTELGINITAVCDTNAQKADDAAKKTGATAYYDFDEMLLKEKIDVLHICTPHYLHTPMAKKAAELGIAVFTEKPPVINRCQITEFLILKDKVPVGICFQNRYNPSTLRVREILSSEEVGKILGGRAFVTWHRNNSYYTESGWRGMLSTEGGGALINQAIHTLDLLIGFIGKPVAVEASCSNRLHKKIIEVEDTLEAYIDFGGIPAVFYATNAYPTNAPVMIDIECENLSIRLEGDFVTIRYKDGTYKTENTKNNADAFGKSYWGNSHKSCIEDFYYSLTQNRKYQNDIESVTDTIKTTIAIYESARGAGYITV